MILDTADLLSKWGFDDGDILHDFKVGHGLKVNSATLLVEVVKRYVLPELRKHHDLKADVVLGLHNPIRVIQVDGVSVDDNDEPSMTLTPAMVDVSDDMILAIANEQLLISEQAEEDQADAGARADEPSQYGPLLTLLHRRHQRQLKGLNDK